MLKIQPSITEIGNILKYIQIFIILYTIFQILY